MIVRHTLASLRAPFKPLSRHKLADDENCRTVGVDPLPGATNRQRATGNGIAVMPSAGC
ncbi:hypothetical protein LHM46_003992 [Salmonella enterica subsp. enterica serovar Bareilly]|nr:hypothetical protein [Salmonella enterica]EII4646866.1 hypothetical protein [Salmonella enterica subsp. enterica serovar Bareilly]